MQRAEDCSEEHLVEDDSMVYKIDRSFKIVEEGMYICRMVPLGLSTFFRARRQCFYIPASRTFTSTPAVKKSAILASGTKYPK